MVFRGVTTNDDPKEDTQKIIKTYNDEGRQWVKKFKNGTHQSYFSSVVNIRED